MFGSKPVASDRVSSSSKVSGLSRVRRAVFEGLEGRQLYSFSDGVTVDFFGDGILADDAVLVDATNGSVGARGRVDAGNESITYGLVISETSRLSASLRGMSADADLEVLDSDGNVVASSYNSGRDAESIRTTLEAGTYFVRVTSFEGAATDFSLSVSTTVQDPTTDTAGDTADEAKPVGDLSGDFRTYSERLSAGDGSDFYSFSLSDSREVSLSLGGMSSDVDIILRDSDGNEVASSRRGGRAGENITANLDAGEYTVEVVGFAGRSTRYTLQLDGLSFTGTTAIGPDRGANTRTAARSLGNLASAGLSVSDFVGTRDANDYFKFSLSSRSDVNFTLRNMAADADFQILDSAGRVVGSSGRGGTSSDGLQTTLNAGEYTARVFRFGGDTRYTFSAQAVPTSATTPDLAGGTRLTGRVVGPVDGTVRAFNESVSRSDREDWYKFEVTSERELSIALDNLDADVDLQLVNSRGVTVASSARSGSDGEGVTARLSPGIYYARVYGFGSTSGYTLLVDGR
jgi:hypothetical protein